MMVGLLTVHGATSEERLIDSLRQLIVSSPPDTLRLSYYRQLCDLQHRFGRYNDALQTATEGLTLARKIQSQVYQARFHFISANELILIRNTSQALPHLQEGLKCALRSKDVALIINGYNDIGNFYKSQDDQPQALLHYLDGLRYAEAHPSQVKPQLLVYLNVNLASLYRVRNQLDQAENHLQKGIRLSEQSRDTLLLGKCLFNNALLAFDRNNFSQAKSLHETSIRYLTQTGDSVAIARNLLQWSILIKKERGDLNEALSKVNRAYGMFVFAGFYKEAAGALNVRNGIYLLKGQNQSARQDGLEALRIGERLQNAAIRREAYLALSQADSALGDYRSAYVHFKQYTACKDSLFNEEKAKEFGRIESKYQFDKEREAEIRRQKTEESLRQAETDRRNNLQYLTIFGLIIGLFIALYISGQFSIPLRLMEISLFAGLLILFEFLLILFDPVLDDFTGGVPIQKLGFNSVIAFVFAPLHRYLEQLIRNRFLEQKRG